MLKQTSGRTNMRRLLLVVLLLAALGSLFFLLMGDTGSPSRSPYPPGHEALVVMNNGEAASEFKLDTTYNPFKAYITPDDPVVQRQLSEILKGRLWILTDYGAIRSWVAEHIRYVSDLEAHGVSEYWQLPRETLERRTGDCEDFTILLCTFLRAYGYSAEEVYVVVGLYERSCHAYLALWSPEKGWGLQEPQYGSWVEFFFGTAYWLEKYEVLYSFNDQHYYRGMPPAPSPEPLISWEIVIHPTPLKQIVVVQPGPLSNVEVTIDLTDPDNIEIVTPPSLLDDIKIIVQLPDKELVLKPTE